jgi:hypothetical protein
VADIGKYTVSSKRLGAAHRDVPDSKDLVLHTIAAGPLAAGVSHSVGVVVLVPCMPRVDTVGVR